MPTLGENIRAARERAKIDRRELSRLLDIAEGTSVVADLENDRYKDITLSRLLKVAKSLKIDVASLIAGVDAEYDAMVRDLIGHAHKSLSDLHARSKEGAQDAAAARVLQQQIDEAKTHLEFIAEHSRALLESFGYRQAADGTRNEKPSARRVHRQPR